MDFREEVKAALREDRAWNDATSRAFIPRSMKARAKIVARTGGVVAGAAASAAAFRLRDPLCRVRLRVPDGRRVRPGGVVLEATGPLASILAAERTALNILTHLSGIATLTRNFIDRAGPQGPKILDTRKTLPGLRDMQKWAVRCGGGTNHRRDLSDAVLIKENHLAAVRGEAALDAFFRRVKALKRRGFIIEMECQAPRHVLWGLFAGADILLLDNVPVGRLRAVVGWIKNLCRARGLKRPLLEVSGGVRLDTVRAIARAGVDRISIGRLTHSAPALDMGLDVTIL